MRATLTCNTCHVAVRVAPSRALTCDLHDGHTAIARLDEAQHRTVRQGANGHRAAAAMNGTEAGGCGEWHASYGGDGCSRSACNRYSSSAATAGGESQHVAGLEWRAEAAGVECGLMLSVRTSARTACSLQSAGGAIVGGREAEVCLLQQRMRRRKRLGCRLAWLPLLRLPCRRSLRPAFCDTHTAHLSAAAPHNKHVAALAPALPLLHSTRAFHAPPVA